MSAPNEIKQQWREKILKQRESGLSIKSWCRQNDIDIHAFRYWRNKFLLKSNIDQLTFKKVSQQKTLSFKLPIANSRKRTEMTIEYQGAFIYIDRNVDISTLRKCLKALKEISC